MLRFRIGLVLVGGLLAVPSGRVLADEADVDDGPPPAQAPGASDLSAEYRALARPPGRAARIVSTLALGRGLRFNNPFRLQTQLGTTAESLSLTSSYLDLGAAFALGPADGLQHGAALHFSLGLAGVRQSSLTPSYLIAYRGPGRVLGYGRLGAAVLLEPDANVGGELAVGLGYFLTAGLAFSGELIGDLFYGAATYEKRYTVYPVVSAQLGIMVDYEILP